MIHESAYVEDAEIGDGTNIWHFVHVRKNARIGRNCNIGKGVYIDTEVEIGDNCKIQNFATVYQGIKIGNDVFIGPHVCFTNDLRPRSAIWSEEHLVKTIVKDGASVGSIPQAAFVAGTVYPIHAESITTPAGGGALLFIG